MHPPLNRRGWLASSSLALLAACAFPPADDGDRALRDAIASPLRSEAARSRDAARHPYDTLRAFGVSPGQRVIEIAPGGGWYTDILV